MLIVASRALSSITGRRCVAARSSAPVCNGAPTATARCRSIMAPSSHQLDGRANDGQQVEIQIVLSLQNQLVPGSGPIEIG